MGGLRQALGLGFELIGFVILGYMAHVPLAEKMEWDPNLCLAGLVGVGFCLWLIHFAVYAARQND